MLQAIKHKAERHDINSRVDYRGCVCVCVRMSVVVMSRLDVKQLTVNRLRGRWGVSVDKSADNRWWFLNFLWIFNVFEFLMDCCVFNETLFGFSLSSPPRKIGWIIEWKITLDSISNHDDFLQLFTEILSKKTLKFWSIQIIVYWRIDLLLEVALFIF